MMEIPISLPVPNPVLDNLSTAVLVLDAQMRFLYLNPAAEQLLTVSGRQSRGLALAGVVKLDDQFRAGLMEARDAEAPYTGREATLTLADGTQRVVDYTASPLQFDGSEAALLVELNSLDRYLRIAREMTLLAQQDATRTLARGFAHEVKNPLGGLRGAAQLLQRQLDDPGLHEYTDIIIREADRLQNLMDRMLGPNSRPELSTISVHEPTEHVFALLRAESPPGVSVSNDYDPSIPSVTVDRDWLIQALLNIARNSLQAVGETGNILVRTRVLLRQTIGGKIHRLVAQIQVIDDGPGIPVSMQDKIFFPMVTGRADGTGLGLSIAQSLVGQLGGLIECASVPGRTVVEVLIPVENGDG
jgi:two-component system nitrogen regulation sensor histidine kinase GlnL